MQRVKWKNSLGEDYSGVGCEGCAAEGWANETIISVAAQRRRQTVKFKVAQDAHCRAADAFEDGQGAGEWQDFWGSGRLEKGARIVKGIDDCDQIERGARTSYIYGDS